MQECRIRVEAESLDNDGFLVDMTQWTREMAEKLANRNDLGPLTEDHWKIIEFVHGYYLKHRSGPPVVKIGKATGLSPSRICQLFPCGMARGGYRLAGLPRPAGCL
jgi:TusE/DsrC/DsvC family sulfur relay protein